NTAFIVGNAAVTIGDSLPVATNFFFEDNIVSHGDYGIFGGNKGEGTVALDFYAPGYTVRKDVFIGGGTANQDPPNNFFAATNAAVGFVNDSGGDYHLAPSSPYKNGASDGTDIGANIDIITSTTGGVAP